MKPRLESYAALARAVLLCPPRLGDIRLVAVDGPGGAGKSVFAARLSRALGGVPVLRTDDFASWEVPLGWWPRLEEQALAPLASGQVAQFRRSDWGSGSPGESGVVEPAPVVILEGVSSSRRAVVGRLALAVWIETDRRERLTRGIARDGEQMRRQWLAWMAEEDVHFDEDRARERADVVVDGAPRMPHDPEAEFVRLR